MSTPHLKSVKISVIFSASVPNTAFYSHHQFLHKKKMNIILCSLFSDKAYHKNKRCLDPDALQYTLFIWFRMSTLFWISRVSPSGPVANQNVENRVKVLLNTVWKLCSTYFTSFFATVVIWEYTSREQLSPTFTKLFATRKVVKLSHVHWNIPP